MDNPVDLQVNETGNITDYGVTIEDLNRQQVLVRLPATILVIATMILGFVGNILTIYVYGFRLKLSPTYLFVVMLASADLIMCGIITPGRIVQNVYPMMTTWDIMCKNHMCLSVFTGLCNCGFLVAIAVDRYRKVCQPLKPQISMTAAKIISACIFVFSAIQGGIVILYYGSIKKPTKYPGLYSYSCSSKNSKKPNYYQLGFFAFYLLITIFTIIFLALFYTIVLRRMRSIVSKSQPVLTSVSNTVSFKTKSEEQSNDTSVSVENQVESSSSVQGINFVDVSITENNSSSNMTSSSSAIQSQENVPSQTPKKKLETKFSKKSSKKSSTKRETNSVRRAREQASRVQRTTVTMMMITFVFVVTYIPSVVSMMANAVLKSESSMSVATAIFYWLARHSFYVNSSVNPIIYGCRNQNFIDEVKKLFRIR